MRQLKFGRDCVLASLSLVVVLLEVKAQTPVSPQAEGQTTSTVVISAARPVNVDSYRAVETRIKNILSHQPSLSSPFLSRCMENRFAGENATAPGGHLPSEKGAALDIRVRCARAHIEAADITLRQGLEAFSKQNYSTALDLFQQEYSKTGTADAALMAAKMYLDGLGVPKDATQGIKWLRETADGKFDPQRDRMRFNPQDPQAMNARVESALMLARIYRDGNGVPQEWKQVEDWYSKAVEFGFIPALDILGQAYLAGQGAEKNVSRAIDCFKRAADAGYIPAAYALGKLYYPGGGAVPDLKLARTYFEQAAEAGHAGALFAVGRMYELGEGAPADPKMAFAFYQEAAEKGNADAESALGALYAKGKIIQTDPVAAHEPVSAAARPVQPDAIRSLGMTRGTSAIVSTYASTVVDAESDGKTFKAAASSSDNPTSDSKRSGPRNDADAGAISVVHVTALRAVPWKSYRAMRAAIAAYEKYKYLAPDAVFSFAILPSAGKTLPPNFELRVRTKDGKEFPIRLEHGELFQLPVLPDPDADANLVSNLKEGQLRIGLLLHSRNVPPEQERLGDVRLRNEISQAISDVEHPNYDPICWRKRGANQCRPQHVTIWYKPRAPASGAWLVEENRKEALETNGDPNYPSYKIPVNAGHLGNDVIIEFDYKNPPGSIKQTVVMIYDESDR